MAGKKKSSRSKPVGVSRSALIDHFDRAKVRSDWIHQVHLITSMYGALSKKNQMVVTAEIERRKEQWIEEDAKIKCSHCRKEVGDKNEHRRWEECGGGQGGHYSWSCGDASSSSPWTSGYY